MHTYALYVLQTEHIDNFLSNFVVKLTNQTSNSLIMLSKVFNIQYNQILFLNNSIQYK